MCIQSRGPYDHQSCSHYLALHNEVVLKAPNRASNARAGDVLWVLGEEGCSVLDQELNVLQLQRTLHLMKRLKKDENKPGKRREEERAILERVHDKRGNSSDNYKDSFMRRHKSGQPTKGHQKSTSKVHSRRKQTEQTLRFNLCRSPPSSLPRRWI